jgi:hypothetical protein
VKLGRVTGSTEAQHRYCINFPDSVTYVPQITDFSQGGAPGRVGSCGNAIYCICIYICTYIHIHIYIHTLGLYLHSPEVRSYYSSVYQNYTLNILSKRYGSSAAEQGCGSGPCRT